MSPAEIDARRRAAAAGDPGALAFTAVLAALGVGEPKDWAAAMARLSQAAAGGDAASARQLELMGGPAADLAAWYAVGGKERLMPEPRISRIPEFLSPAVCQWLIERVAGRTRRAQVFDPASGLALEEDARSNSAFEFDLPDLDIVTLLVRERIAAATGMPAGTFEPMQVLHYAPGEKFDLHFDFLDPAEPGLAADMRERGQRVATFLVYLNAGFEGGETDFPQVGLRFRGQTGEALMFANVDRAGQPDRRTLHAGLAPLSGEKWLLSQWIRDRMVV